MTASLYNAAKPPSIPVPIAIAQLPAFHFNGLNCPLLEPTPAKYPAAIPNNKGTMNLPLGSRNINGELPTKA
ncbi:MAG: hypothetical protein HY22_09565 [[Candidatus Thermochlorobacteriaceae] bacterium GBChlB]|nr:MAG: hypothetical protein HY22_09565 [[Candidatus Thermochlorobacteriaceae] bacterium GBChlB]